MSERGALWALLAVAATAALAAAQTDASGEEGGGAGGAGLWSCTSKRLCPEGGDDQACVASQAGCPVGYVSLEGAAACGCCKGCVKAQSVGEYCDEQNPCAYGYFCDTENTVTIGNITVPSPICSPGKCTLELEKWNAAEEKNQWRPTCARDGSFAGVQCKGQIGGDGRCFCWSPDGKRLYGEAVWGKASEEMDCACSLAALTAKKEHEAPRCTADGSFEVLQCAAGVCWCADRRTGNPKGRAVPIAAMSSLICYNLDDVGLQYRRVCDSVMEANAELRRVYLSHGGSDSGLPDVACDLNGGHGAVQTRVSGTETFCSRQDKTPIESFFQDTDPKRPMNCNCARDTDAFGEKLPCYANGNYKARISEGDYVRCIDSDGYFYERKSSSKVCDGEIN